MSDPNSPTYREEWEALFHDCIDPDCDFIPFEDFPTECDMEVCSVSDAECDDDNCEDACACEGDGTLDAKPDCKICLELCEEAHCHQSSPAPSDHFESLSANTNSREHREQFYPFTDSCTGLAPLMPQRFSATQKPMIPHKPLDYATARNYAYQLGCMCLGDHALGEPCNGANAHAIVAPSSGQSQAGTVTCGSQEAHMCDIGTIPVPCTNISQSCESMSARSSSTTLDTDLHLHKESSVTVSASTSDSTLDDLPQEYVSDDPARPFKCLWLEPSTVGQVPPALCGHVFASSQELSSHLKNVHAPTFKNAMQDRKWFCRWATCTRTEPFPVNAKLRRHLIPHSSYKPLKCAHCGLGLSSKQALEQHERIHTGEEPWVCREPGCGQTFKQQSALTMHERVHTGLKPLECEFCGKRFAESSNLCKHRRIHQEQRKYFCVHCPERFIRQDHLLRHIETHHSTHAHEQIDHLLQENLNSFEQPQRS